MRYLLILFSSVVISGCVGDSEQAISNQEVSGGTSVDSRGELLGTDSDNNGVRDDIDSYILDNYSEPKRDAVRQVARAFQNVLTVDRFDTEALDQASSDQFKAIVCATEVYGSDRAGAFKMIEVMEALTTNSQERLSAYIDYTSARSGSVSSYPEGDTCE